MSVQQLAKKAAARDKQTAKEEKTLTKKHKEHVTKAATPSHQDKDFKNTRAEVGPSTGAKIAPQSAPSAPSPKKTGLFSSSSSSSSGAKKFCPQCGTHKGAGAFCSQCGEKL